MMKIWHQLLNAMIWCSFACEVLGMPAISESNPFVSMPLSSKFMNKWWLTHYWVLQQALTLLYVLQASLLTISCCNHLPNHIMCSYRYSLMFWPFAIFSLLQPVMKIPDPLHSNTISGLFTSEARGMACYLYYAVSESNPFVNMPSNSGFMNKRSLPHYWGL